MTTVALLGALDVFLKRACMRLSRAVRHTSGSRMLGPQPPHVLVWRYASTANLTSETGAHTKGATIVGLQESATVVVPVLGDKGRQVECVASC